MEIKTIAGKMYAVSSRGACTITASVNGVAMTLASLSNGGQCSFQAVGDHVEVSDPSAVVMSFDGAPVPLGMGGGASSAQVAEMVESAVNDFECIGFSTPAGTDDATFQYIELDAQRVPAGKLKHINLSSRSTGSNPSTFSYLAIWELGEDGETWSYRGSSTNAPGQAMGKHSIWLFEEGEIVLSGRKVRFLAQAERSDVWELGPKIGAHVSTTPGGDESIIFNEGSEYRFLPTLSLGVCVPKPKFAPADHVKDTVAHVSHEEHGWLTGLRTGTASGAVPVLMVTGTQGNPLLVVRGNLTNTTVTGNELSFNVPRLTVMSDCPALYSYDADTGETHVWFAVAPDAVSLAPLGIREIGTHIGDPSLPMCLKGSELRFNGTVFGGTEQSSGMPITDSADGAVTMEHNAVFRMPDDATTASITPAPYGDRVVNTTLFWTPTAEVLESGFTGVRWIYGKPMMPPNHTYIIGLTQVSATLVLANLLATYDA